MGLNLCRVTLPFQNVVKAMCTLPQKNANTHNFVYNSKRLTEPQTPTDLRLRSPSKGTYHGTLVSGQLKSLVKGNEKHQKVLSLLNPPRYLRHLFYSVLYNTPQDYCSPI